MKAVCAEDASNIDASTLPTGEMEVKTETELVVELKQQGSVCRAAMHGLAVFGFPVFENSGGNHQQNEPQGVFPNRKRKTNIRPIFATSAIRHK